MSKGLELFQALRKSLSEELNVSSVANNKLDIIEKELKALEIIKEFNVDTIVFVQYVKEKPNDEWALASYNNYCKDKDNCKYYDGRDYLKPKPLNKEKYDLLKEELL